MEKNKEKFINVFFRRTVILEKFLLSGIRVLVSNPYWKDKNIVFLSVFGLLVNICLWIFLVNNKIESDYPIILHYNLFFGVDYLGNYEKIYLIPLTGLIIIFINSILGHILYAKEKLVAYFLIFNMLIIQMFLLFAGYLIIKVN